jgi:hypothetical protein
MSDTQTTSSDTSTTSNANQATTPPSQCHRGACCKPHTSLYISVAALALAGYAAFSVNSSSDNSAMQTQVDTIDSKLSGINQQMEALSEEVQHNRDNLVQNKLKKALENIRDISGLAEEGSKAAISKVESMLQDLTTLGEALIAPTQEEAPLSTEQTTPATTMTQPATSPIEPATEESTPAEAPAATAADKTVTTQPAPTKDTPAAESNAPIASPAASKPTKPTPKAMPEINLSTPEPSVPQAF